MRQRSKLRSYVPVAAAMACSLPTAAAAQAISLPSVSAEITTDARRRGISWSEGKPALQASASLPIGPITIDATALTTRGSLRHGGADAAIDLGLWYSKQIGLVGVSAAVVGHMFPGGADMGYAEGIVGGNLVFGPARMDVSVAFAPAQDAIGGSNLHLGAEVSVGIPVTPFTVYAGIGHSSGSVRDIALSARLRPGGSYTDARVGVDYVIGPVSVGAQLVTTSISQEPLPAFDDSGTKLIARAGVSF